MAETLPGEGGGVKRKDEGLLGSLLERMRFLTEETAFSVIQQYQDREDPCSWRFEYRGLGK